MMNVPLIARLNNNPIVRAEMLYQQRASVRPPRWRHWLVRGVYLLALATAMIYFWGEFAAVVFQRDPGPLYEQDTLIILSWLMAIVTLVMHLWVMLRTLRLASASVSREKQSGTRESLKLTGITLRQWVVGKWWATLRTMGRSYLLLALLRAGLVIWWGAFLSRGFALAPVLSLGGNANYVFTLPPAFLILLAGGLMLLFTLLAGALTAAIGVLASLLAWRPSAALLPMGLAIGLVVVVILALLFGGGPMYEVRIAGPNVGTVLAATAGTIADNGTTVTMLLSQPQSVFTNSYYNPAPIGWSLPQDVMPTVAFSLVFYLLAIWGMLALAQRAAARQGLMSPPMTQGKTP
jgi:hypothetical protein